jgi:antitoxin (DNA-binding transcriptional repressor) of toxin-antitoxin stability system
MAVIHISETDAARDFAAVMAHVRAGDEVFIENGSSTVAVLRAASPQARMISECIALAKKHETETGEAVIDPDFAANVAEIIQKREPWDPPAWD